MIVGCLYKANDAIRILFEYGGVDIYALNSKKKNAYQIAVDSGNE